MDDRIPHLHLHSQAQWDGVQWRHTVAGSNDKHDQDHSVPSDLLLSTGVLHQDIHSLLLLAHW